MPALPQRPLDLLATNRLGRALYAQVFRDPVRPANNARFTFFDPAAPDFWDDWERIADDTVGILRGLAGRNPYDESRTDLVGELSTRSEEFRTRWAAHNVRVHGTGQKLIHHPVVGRLELMYDVLHLPSDPELTVLVYTAEPGSPMADALTLLASWAATLDAEAREVQATRADTRTEQPPGDGAGAGSALAAHHLVDPDRSEG